jgi:hypothetical protein
LRNQLAFAIICKQGRSQTITGVTVVTGPRGAPEGSQKGSGPRKGCENKGRCSSFFLRKKIRTKNRSKGVLRVVGGPESP